MTEPQFPKARADCLSKKFNDEVLVYDPQRHVGHCLNSTAAAVLKLCNGKNSPSQIALALLQRLPSTVDEALVLLTLKELTGAHLLVEGELPAPFLSRRGAIRRIGMATAVVLPLVTSVVAPTPAHAASCMHAGQPCGSNGQCCSGNCNPNSHRCTGG